MGVKVNSTTITFSFTVDVVGRFTHVVYRGGGVHGRVECVVGHSQGAAVNKILL